jgi:hypothetical protein
LSLGFLIYIVCGFGILAPSQRLYRQHGSAEDASNVSGFYGPGNYLGWQLTATVTGLQYVTDVKGPKPSSPDWAGFSATLVYTAVAAVDVLSHISKENADAQLDAALMTCHFALLVSGACLLLTMDAPPWSRWTGRGWWLGLFIVAVVGTVGDFAGSFTWFEMARLCWPVVVAQYSLSDDAESRAIWVAAGIWWTCIFSFVLTMSLELPQYSSFRFAFPRSGAHFGDLDQISVLIAWGVGSGYVLMPASRRRSIAKSAPVAKIRLLMRWNTSHRLSGDESSTL